MKGNIKNLAVLVIIAVVVPFIIAAIASADHEEKNIIQGEYYFIGAGPCLVAPGGFNSILQPNTGELGPWNTSNSTWEGVISFKGDNTGALTSIFRVVERPSYYWPPLLSGPLPAGDIPDLGAANVSWTFDYTVSNHGRITFTYETGSYVADWKYGPQQGTQLYLNAPGQTYGVLSPDGNNIVVTWGVPSQLIVTADQANKVPLFPVICNVVLQGFLCRGKCPELVYSPPPGP
jgi:hypothetical protein